MTGVWVCPLLVVATIATTCGADDDSGPTVLVSRVRDVIVENDCGIVDPGSPCTVGLGEHHLVAADGTSVVAQPAEYVVNLDFVQDVEVRCAGVGNRRLITAIEWDGAGGLDSSPVPDDLYRSETAIRLEATPAMPTRTYVFADGGQVELVLSEALFLDSNGCFDGSGRWRGVAGSFEGRQGTYRNIHNGLQTELVLVDERDDG